MVQRGKGGLVKNMRNIRSRKAVSPVIATVILVAVAITVAVAVAYWMGGIAGQYTKFEKVEVQTAVCTYDSTNTYWKVAMKLKNTGTATATMVAAFINDVEVQNYGNDAVVAGQTSTNMTVTTTTVASGETKNVNFYLDLGYLTLSSGTTINIKVHSAGGMDYIKLVELV
jgi:flagellin-like protein